MSEGLFGVVESIIEATQRRFYGVTIGVVIDINDPLGQGRIKVKLPWFSESEETGWARIATPVAGSNYGFYFMPKTDEEVLVAFEHGDIELPYIIGRLWNLQDSPPEYSPLPGKSHIRTNAGHDVIFDDIQQSIEIKTSTSQRIKLDPLKIELSNLAGSIKITLDETGQKITLQAPMGIELKSTNIKLEGANIEIDGALKTEIKSAGLCNVQGSLVKIN